MTLAELATRITTSNWFDRLLLKLSESVGFTTGCPNSGKSSLAVSLAKCLGLVKTRTTSRNCWLFSRNSRPYFSIWIFCTDFFYDGTDFNWDRMKQSVDSKLGDEEFRTGAMIIEGHRALAYPDWGHIYLHWQNFFRPHITSCRRGALHRKQSRSTNCTFPRGWEGWTPSSRTEFSVLALQRFAWYVRCCNCWSWTMRTSTRRTSEQMSWMGVGASSPKWQSLPPVIIAGGNGRRVSSSCLRSPWALLQCPDFTDNLILPSGNLLHSYWNGHL
jgi:hypothetical protein